MPKYENAVKQPEKKTVPEPLVPLMQGSSQKWSAARASFGAYPIRQYPSPSSSRRSALHYLEH